KPVEEKVPVSVAVAQSKDVPNQIRAIGNVQPRSTVSVKALVGGQLTRVWFREGEDVSQGQLLFTIDPRPLQASLAQARANLARDEAQLRNAESEAARYTELVKKDYVTKEEYGRITSTAEAARAVVAADRAGIENANLQLSYCEIRSPLNGRTGTLMVHQGNIVKPNDIPLVTINEITPVNVQFAVPESQLAVLRTRGLGSVPVTAVLQGGHQPIGGGTLSFVDNAVDSSTGTINLKATFPNRDRALWPGQFVDVAVTLSSRPNAVVIPTQAVQNSQKGQYVYIVKQDGGVEMRPVQVAQTMDAQQSVIEHGVAAGETVVTDGQVRLTPKSKVDVKGRA
ncbi:MAG: Efflux transporter periplasmic adaptor subunit, partial [Acidobacteria bacterium]|nr:Efflux transporter periplasmic adaptor subunit [Acidobacteriota bacterium]